MTVLQRSERIIPDDEPEVAEALADYLRQEGIAIHSGVRLLSIRQQDDMKVIHAEVNEQRQEFRAEAVLMAVGRTPNTRGLGLEGLGVAADAQGFIEVDEFMRTKHPRVYAAGDVTTGPEAGLRGGCGRQHSR